jgi:hypothetical protein
LLNIRKYIDAKKYYFQCKKNIPAHLESIKKLELNGWSELHNDSLPINNITEYCNKHLQASINTPEFAETKKQAKHTENKSLTLETLLATPLY